MTSTAQFPLFSVEINREDVPVAMMTPASVPDEKWRYVDKKKHGHFWVGDELPTLKWVVTGKCWVGDEYDGDEVEIGEHRCRWCDEVIEPGRRTEYGPSHIPGPTWITVTINGESFVVDPDGYAKSVDVWAEHLRANRR